MSVMNVRAIAIILACACSAHAITAAADDLSETRHQTCLGLAKVAMTTVKAREDGLSLDAVKKTIPQDASEIAASTVAAVITFAYNAREIEAGNVSLVVYTACSVATMEPQR